MHRPEHEPSLNGKDGVWTHRYTVSEIRDALRQARARDGVYFRSGGRLQDVREGRSRGRKA